MSLNVNLRPGKTLKIQEAHKHDLAPTNRPGLGSIQGTVLVRISPRLRAARGRLGQGGRVTREGLGGRRRRPGRRRRSAVAVAGRRRSEVGVASWPLEGRNRKETRENRHSMRLY